MPARPLRRVVAVLACSACLLLLPQAASSLPSGGASRAGEPGSGPPTWNADRAADGALATTDVQWSDVPNSLWARTAIDYVGATNDWMREWRPEADGRYAFRPDRLESRRLFARSLFRAFGEGLPEDPNLSFADVPASDRFYPFPHLSVSDVG